MGGIGMLAVTTILSIPAAVLLSAYATESQALSLLLMIGYGVLNGLIGIFDDLKKVTNHQNAGLTPLQKLALQSVVTIAFLWLWGALSGYPATLHIPYFHKEISLGVFFYVFLFFFLLWFVNCANLTDGIDGLATSVGSIIGLFFVVVGIMLSRADLTGVGSLLLGCGIGFLIFNKHPAKIFMGDTGSLFLGGLSAAGACVIGSPLLFFLVGGVYLWEGLSVALQVLFFKATKGKRLFLMAPYHHHLEKKGWHEKEIVLYLSLLTILFCLLALMGVAHAQ
jgi:phospho-N-acetylmuramoyl-pentapeptide-transferase